MKIILVKSKIDRKYFPLIWTVLILSSLFNALYVLIAELGDCVGVKEITVNVLVNILYEGVLPAFLCYCSASIFSSMAIRRGMRDITHSDFIYLTMIFTAAARFVMGIVKVCALANYAVYVYASYICDVTVLSASLYAMFFAVLDRKFYVNPFSSRNSFRLWSSVYLVCQGVHTLVPSISNFIMRKNPMLAEKITTVYESYGVQIDTTVTEDMIIASIVAISVFVLLVAVTVALYFWLDYKAKNFVPADVFGDDDDDNPFEDEGGDKVFEEFDI